MMMRQKQTLSSGQEPKDDHTPGIHTDPTIETLRTPPVKITPAPILKRVAAGFLDSAIITALWLAVIFIQQLSPTQFSLFNEGYLILVTFTYYFIFEGFSGSTVGKKILRLRVVDWNGDSCSFTSSFLRNTLRFIDWLPFLYLLGLAFVLTSKERLRIGDRAARTIVTTAAEKDINPPPAPFLFH
jgi:uncharacterized RDD family membrane protein YckC